MIPRRVPRHAPHHAPNRWPLAPRRLHLAALHLLQQPAELHPVPIGVRNDSRHLSTGAFRPAEGNRRSAHSIVLNTMALNGIISGL